LQDRIRIRSVEVLSDEWAVLKKTVFDYRRNDGAWETQIRQTYDRGDGAVILPYDRERGTVLLVRQFRYAAYVTNLQMSFSQASWLRVIQMLPLPFCFISITNAAYIGLPKRESNQVAGLINFARNIGGSVLIAITNAQVTTRSLWHQHAEWLTFHNNLSTPHPWESGPWSWLVDGRPILLWNPQKLTDAAGEQVVRYILMVGTPVLWFAFAPATLWLLWRIVARRDPAALTVAVAIAAGWGTWFINLDRTMFIFYMAPVVPFFVLAVVLVLQDVLGRDVHADGGVEGAGDDAAVFRRQVGLGVVCGYVAVVAATFVFFWPVLTGQPLSHIEWMHRMWFPSWF